ncbi:MAG: sodium:solute symporter [Chitinophagales bacterium]|nr:sodium:solute symporter [Chitinophagales bacterium]MDW8428856.1 sodium:solute symporter [Chitinophagales bacterium]
MSPILILILVLTYFLSLLWVARVTSRGADAHAFYIGGRQSRWYVVAYGMIGTSLSGVTFVSVPGEVGIKQWAYLQIVLGYWAGYIVIALVLLPLYYRLQVTSIYSYLLERFGSVTYRTGSAFFIISRTLGATARIFLVVNMLQVFVLDPLGIPFMVTAAVIVLFILLYTLRGGVKTIVWTDLIQTTCMLASLVLSIWLIAEKLQLSLSGLMHTISQYELTKTFFWEWRDRNFFVKQFLSGMFITIAMTGLDQEMMQKNLSCRNLSDAQKNMFTFSVVLVVVNLLFLFLGATLYAYMFETGIAAPARSDDVFPMLALQHLGQIAALIFLVGLISALYPSADGALTALTSAFCIDILGLPQRQNLSEVERTRIRYLVHIGFAVIFLLCLLVFRLANKTAIITTVLTIAGYTYGPLLGLYAFGLLTRSTIADRKSWLVCVLAPLISHGISLNSEKWFFGYQLGFELLLVNALLTFLGLWLISRKNLNSAKVVAES